MIQGWLNGCEDQSKGKKRQFVVCFNNFAGSQQRLIDLCVHVELM